MKAKWHRLRGAGRSKPPKSGSVWVYCPTYWHMKVRSTSVEMLEWCVDATHWHLPTQPKPERPTEEG